MHADPLTAFRRLVRTVAAIRVVIAHEMFGDALLILALELRVVAGLIVLYKVPEVRIKNIFFNTSPAKKRDV